MVRLRATIISRPVWTSLSKATGKFPRDKSAAWELPPIFSLYTTPWRRWRRGFFTHRNGNPTIRSILCPDLYLCHSPGTGHGEIGHELLLTIYCDISLQVIINYHLYGFHIQPFLCYSIRYEQAQGKYSCHNIMSGSFPLLLMLDNRSS
jgi:hypothetical protein